MTLLSIDIETFSHVDLIKSGSHVYAEHPSTRVLCLAYAIDDGPVCGWQEDNCTPLPENLKDAASNPDVIFHAWNAGGFEMLILPKIGLDVPLERWRDTMIHAAYWGLPMGLDAAASALDLSIEKDKEGQRLMKMMSKPRRSNGERWDQAAEKQHADKPQRLLSYCMNDVELERAIRERLSELPDALLNEWRLDWRMMQRGFSIDAKRVHTLECEAGKALAKLNAELREVVGENVTVNSVAKLLAFCKENGLPELESLDKASLAALPLGETPAHKVAAIRQEAAKSSVAKLKAMTASTCRDGTVKGLTQFYGAGRTGRWAGRLVQVQNLPRPIKEPKTKLEEISSSLRSCFSAPAGKTFVIGDFAQIEARVLAWLAGQNDVLEVFARGDDVYTYTARKLGSDDRTLGKVLTLACGYGMGHIRFKDTAATYGLDLTEGQARMAVRGWRNENAAIVAYWTDIEACVRQVISGQKQFGVGRNIRMAMGRGRLEGCLIVRLPSGRHLTYRDARLEGNPERPDWAPAITYSGVNQITRQWGTMTSYGGKLVENITQAVARDLLMYALTLFDFPGSWVQPLVTIHDEIVALAPEEDAEKAKLLAEHWMTKAPAWAEGLPLAADVKISDRYQK